MARSRSPDSIVAEELYNKGMSLVEIAKKLDKPEGTVRRWKSTQGWGDKSERSEKKANVRNDNRTAEKKAIAEDVEQVVSNPDLTDKQRLFCLHYVRCFNATKAYQKAYGVDYLTANAHGYEMLSKVVIKDEINRLKQNRLNREMMDESDIVQKHIDIAFADIKDFVEFGNKEITTTDESGKEIMIKVSSVNIRNDKNVDGTLISEISKGKDGVKVKLLDKMRSLDWLWEHMDFVTPEQGERLRLLKCQADKMEAEAKMAKHKADKLEANGKAFELLESLVKAVESRND